MPIVFIATSVVIVSVFALWCARELERIAVLEPLVLEKTRVERLHDVRSAGTSAMLGQFFCMMGVAFSMSSFGRPIMAAIYVVFLAILVLQGQLQFQVEKILRNIEVSAQDSTRLALRGVGTGIGLLGLYILAFKAGLVGLAALIRALPLTEGWGTIAIFLSYPLSILFALGLAALLGPVALRFALPCSRLDDPATRNILAGCFRRAGLAVPRLFTLELDRFRAHNAMISGLAAGRGPFRQVLVFSPSLLKSLTPQEFEAVMLHEVSHVALKHMRKRLFFGAFVVLASLLPVIAILWGLSTLMPPQYLGVSGIFSFLMVLSFQVGLQRTQVAEQELEADLHAVRALGADIEAYSRALGKIATMNDQSLTRKDPQSLLCVSCAHPVAERRIAYLREQLANPPRGIGWSFGRATMTQKIVALSLLLTVCLLGGKGAHRLSRQLDLLSAAKRGDVAAMQASMARGAIVDHRVHSFFFDTPLLAAIVSKNESAAEFLLRAGATPEGKGMLPEPPICGAADLGLLQVIDALLTRGADVNARGLFGQTALMRASGRGHVSVVAHLIAKGADVDARDDMGGTARGLARRLERADVLELLVKAKAVDDDLHLPATRSVSGERTKPQSQ